MRAFCEFQGGLTPDAAVCLWLWEYWRALSPPPRKGLLLRFATGSHRVPLDGFDPPFTLVDGGEPDGPSGPTAAASAPSGPGRPSFASVGLPRAHTCFNQLVLPRFPSYETLSRAFDVALDHTDDGFLLS